jgi:hypothetical protein
MIDKRMDTANFEINTLKCNLDWALESAKNQSNDATDRFIKIAKDRLARVEGMIIRISMGNLSDEDWDMYKDYPIQKKENRQ